MSYIELNDIHFRYEDGDVPVFSGLSMRVERGELVLIRGENGCGKTTLFKIVNGLAFPEAGQFSMDGTIIHKKYLADNAHSKAFHQKVGYLFQNPDIMLFNARVYDEVAFGPRQMGLSEEEVASRTEDCLKMFGLLELEDRAPYHLSGGQKKRVALAAVLALNPEVLVLDEPFSGLDQKWSEALLTLLEDLKNAGKTIIVASHDAPKLEQMADRTIEL